VCPVRGPRSGPEYLCRTAVCTTDSEIDNEDQTRKRMVT
jgi:hypothetical protein